MSTSHKPWNDDDGPEPTEEERREAEAFATALRGDGTGARVVPLAARQVTSELMETVARVRATVRVDDAFVTQASARAVDQALASRSPRWFRSRWLPFAAAASVVIGIGSVGLVRALQRPIIEPPGHSISRDARDVFTSPIEGRAGSEPIDKLTSSRLRSYRDVLTQTQVP